MNSKKVFIVSLGLIIIVYSLFVVSYWNYTHDREQRRVDSHGKVIASAMWDFEAEGMREYFQLACKAYYYKHVLVAQSTGEAIIELDHSLQPMDRFLFSIGLFPISIIESDVIYKEQVIGRVTVKWHNSIIYISFYVLILAILLATVLYFFLRTTKAKQELEVRVEERTTHLQKEITERKQAKKELEQFAQRLAVHVKQTPLGVIEWDLNFKVAQWNKAAEKIFGYTYDEALGQHAADIIVPDLAREHVDHIWKDLIAKKGGTSSTNINITKDGEQLICDWYNTTLIDPQDAVIGVASLVLDITERKKAENEIREQKSFIQDAIDVLTDTFFVFDPFDNKALLWNKAFEKISGYTNKEISSLKAPENYYSKEDFEKACNYVENILSGETGTVDLELICKDGVRVPTEYSASVLRDGEGKPKTIISIGRDVSERKIAESEKRDLESQLRQAHKMEAIGTLAGGIAHDFNNILAAMLGYAEIAIDEVQKGSEAQKDIQEVIVAGKRAKELVKHILAFSRKSEQERSPVSIHLIVVEALKLLRASIPTTIDIQFNADSKCGSILANPTQVHQVIMNLCTNAAQAMDENGGILEVTINNFEFSNKEMKNEPIIKLGQYIKLTVRDTGPGIDQNNITRIFDPYFTTKDIGKGSGMGLAVVQGIVQSHDGIITVDSKPGKGVTFNVFFPQIEETLEYEVEKRELLPIGAERILIIDDEVSVANMTKRRLERLGYHVTKEIDSIVALELFRSNPNAFDLIITDQTMPKMTGEQLANELKGIKPDIPIILCTGYSSKIDAEGAKGFNFSAFIMKPVARKELANTIRDVLDVV